MEHHQKLIWVDLEMSGLNAATDHILEIGVTLTDVSLEHRIDGPSLVIHHPKLDVSQMHPVVAEMHRTSGLLEAVQQSTVNMQEAETLLLTFIQAHCAPKSALLAGNSVWKDREFLQRFMPCITDYVHYRLIDVSSIKELIKQWYGYSVRKTNTHRVKDDINASIQELQELRAKFFVPQ